MTNLFYMLIFLTSTIFVYLITKTIKCKYYNVFINFPIAIRIYNRKGRLINCNNSYMELFNTKKIDKKINLFNDLKLSQKNITKLTAGNKIRYEKDIKIINAFNKQEMRVMRITIIPIIIRSKVRGFIEQINDITKEIEDIEELLFLSYRDSLTGLYNRRYFEEELKKLDNKTNLPLTVVMGDVNGLKNINDNMGHNKGDELIKRTAEIISKECRADDIIARVGGDEFFILLPKTSTKKANEIIRRINTALSNEVIGTETISISFGIKSKETEDQNIQEILEKAEKRMYDIKIKENNGRI